MYFNCHIQVTIGNYSLGSIVSCKVKNQSSDLGSECELVIPLNCRLNYKDGTHNYLTAYSLAVFNVGDPITITANYDGYPQVKVFNGFVVDFVQGTPLTIKCLDYIYNLRLTTLNLNYKSITIQQLFTNVLKDTGVSLILPTIEFTLVNISFRLMSPAAIIEWIKKEIGLNISLSGNQLYCNVASNNLKNIFFDTRNNVIGCKLQKQNTIFHKLKVKAWFVMENGKKDSIEVGDIDGHVVDKFFYKVKQDGNLYTKLATEALNKEKQKRYSGHITTLLYPDCELFDTAAYNDYRYPDRSGNYSIVGNDIEISDKGYHRELKFADLDTITKTGL